MSFLSHWMHQGYPTYWQDIKQNSPLRMTQPQSNPWSNWFKAVKTTKWEEIEAFLSNIIHGHAKLGNNKYVMTQAPEKGKEPCLPHGLSMVNTYTEMTTGSRHITVVIKNQTAAQIIVTKGIKVTKVVAANRIPPIEVMPGTLEVGWNAGSSMN